MRYGLEQALHAENEITCPDCMEEVNAVAIVPSTTPYADLGWIEFTLPFLSIGLFAISIYFKFIPYGLGFGLLSVIVMFYAAYRLVKIQSITDKIGKEQLEDLLDKSPNKGRGPRVYK